MITGMENELPTAELWSIENNDDSYAQQGESRDTPPPDYFPDLEKFEDSRLKKCCIAMRFGHWLLLIILVGFICLFVGAFAETKVYICGANPPPPEGIEDRGAPRCLETDEHEPMCLMAGIDPDEPGVWFRGGTEDDDGSWCIW